MKPFNITALIMVNMVVLFIVLIKMSMFCDDVMMMSLLLAFKKSQKEKKDAAADRKRKQQQQQSSSDQPPPSNTSPDFTLPNERDEVALATAIHNSSREGGKTHEVDEDDTMETDKEL